MNKIEIGDCREIMRQWVADGVTAQTCVTSPPYFGLRDYGADGQIGLEGSLFEFVDNMVEVFELVRELLAPDGTLWLNLGDAYSEGGGGFRKKQQFGIPWRVAIALQDAGWYLRQDIIWHKPNPMPESCRDRCTKSHEYLFLLAKSRHYYFDQKAIQEPVSTETSERVRRERGARKPVARINPLTKSERDRHVGHLNQPNRHDNYRETADLEGRNKRSVWSVPIGRNTEGHFATYPPELIEPCILAGSKPGQVVLDPFMGSGTTAAVAQRLGRQYLGCEINPEYAKLADNKTSQGAFNI